MKAKPFVLGVLSTVVLFTAMSFAIFRPNGLLGARPTATPIASWQLTLDRVFHAPVTILSSAVTLTMPATNGVVITSLHWDGGAGVDGLPHGPACVRSFSIYVNGMMETFGPFTNGSYQSAVGGNNEILHLEPPIIAKPGDQLHFTTNDPGTTVVLGGYIVYPGEV